LQNVEGHLFYASHDAVLEVASTQALATWTEKLKSDRIGASAVYKTQEPWFVEGEFMYQFISDGNNRTNLMLSGGYKLNRFFSVGLNHNSIRAKQEADAYWSPDQYQTFAGWATLHNSFTKWNYRMRGSIGRVQSTGDATREFSADLGYNPSERLNVGFAYSTLNTSRVDGEYQYSRWSLSLNWSL